MLKELHGLDALLATKALQVFAVPLMLHFVIVLLKSSLAIRRVRRLGERATNPVAFPGVFVTESVNIGIELSMMSIGIYLIVPSSTSLLQTSLGWLFLTTSIALFGVCAAARIVLSQSPLAGALVSNVAGVVSLSLAVFALHIAAVS